MKKIISILLVLAVFLSFDRVFIFEAFAAGIDTTAKAAVLIEAKSNKIIYAKNENKPLPMASTTKIMTGLIALENIAADYEITIDSEVVKVEGSSLGLQGGYVISNYDLVSGLLLESGNDAANVIAHEIGGSLEGFAGIMNKRALELGLKNTNFVTPSGLDAENHYTTAYDLALLTSEALKNPDFAEIVSQKRMQVCFGDPPIKRYITNHNRLINEYEGCIGVKTGFTKKSGRCLVSAAKRDGITLIAVTLNAPDDWTDHKKMLDYGFSRLKSFELNYPSDELNVSIVGGVENSVKVLQYDKEIAGLSEGDFDRVKKTFFLPRFEYAPIKKGQKLGYIAYELDGVQLAKIPLLASKDIDYYIPPKKPSLAERIKGFFKEIKNK